MGGATPHAVSSSEEEKGEERAGGEDKVEGGPRRGTERWEREEMKGIRRVER
jgi:hypothetical protein